MKELTLLLDSDIISGRNILNKTMPLVEHFRHHGKTRLALDVGCSIGEYSLEYQRYFENVMAFDPIPSILENDYIDWNKVHYTQCGLTNSDNDVQYFFQSSLQPSRSSFFKTEKCKDASSIQTCKIDTLRLQDVDYIKIDVEHGFLDVILGGLETIREYTPTIQVEWSPETRQIEALLSGLGYRLILDNGFLYNKEKGVDKIRIDSVFVNTS